MWSQKWNVPKWAVFASHDDNYDTNNFIDYGYINSYFNYNNLDNDNQTYWNSIRIS